MDILIIGNGFDIANGLPTRYSEFLKTCKLARKDEVSWESIHNVSVYIQSREEERKYLLDFSSKLGKDYFQEFQHITRSNLFVAHFIDRENQIGENWINFEEEIERFIRAVIKEKDESQREKFSSTSIPALREFVRNRTNLKGCTYKVLFGKILEEQKTFIRLLEIYMAGYVNKLSIGERIKQIRPYGYNGIISFNYTNTFLEKYEPGADYCYIHGKARLDKTEKCDMVLGFDDHYKGLIEIDNELIPYEKFFQRLDLKTSTEYLKWVKGMSNDSDNIVEIFGHSLAPADGDILRMFILAPKTRTIIYYVDDSDRFEKLRNLTQVLGPDKIIELVGGVDFKIKFEQI